MPGGACTTEVEVVVGTGWGTPLVVVVGGTTTTDGLTVPVPSSVAPDPLVVPDAGDPLPTAAMPRCDVEDGEGDPDVAAHAPTPAPARTTTATDPTSNHRFRTSRSRRIPTRVFHRWPAVHRSDAAHLARRAVESAPADSVVHPVADEGVPSETSPW